MAWWQLSLTSRTQRAEGDEHESAVAAIEDSLFALGAVSVTLLDGGDQPLLEPGVGETPLWDSITFQALFDQGIGEQQLLEKLRATFNTAEFDWQLADLPEQDWERSWMDQYQPMCFGQRLWICPSWLEPPADAAVVLKLDPGLAFGTGTHPTTDLCLQWLDGYDCKAKTMVDFGCGSGVLALAALLLGAHHVYAIDNDPQALQATRANAADNGIDESRLTVLAADDPLCPTVQADTVLANILAAPLIELKPILSKILRPCGDMVMSGMLTSQQHAIIEAYTDTIAFQPPSYKEEWLRLNGSKRA